VRISVQLGSVNRPAMPSKSASSVINPLCRVGDVLPGLRQEVTIAGTADARVRGLRSERIRVRKENEQIHVGHMRGQVPRRQDSQ